MIGPSLVKGERGKVETGCQGDPRIKGEGKGLLVVGRGRCRIDGGQGQGQVQQQLEAFRDLVRVAVGQAQVQ